MRKNLFRFFLLFALLPLLVACIKPLPDSAAAGVTPTANDTAQPAEAAPHFTNPRQIDNSFLPLSHYAQTISLGQEEGKANRIEATLFAANKEFDLHGETVEASVLQVIDSTERSLVEVTYEYYAQADDGGVYLLGEEISNYEEGKLVDHEGSWLAGQDGAMPILIMPAKPAVGVFYTAQPSTNSPFQSIEMVSVTQNTTTPLGSTDQGLLVKVSLTDGSTENNTYVADFGLVESQNDEEQLHLVLANRNDAAAGDIPQPLNVIEAQAEDLIDILPSGNWKNIAGNVEDIANAWETYQAQIANDRVPQPFVDALNSSLEQLQKGTAAQDETSTHQAANDVSAALMDLFALYQPATPVDLGRLDVLGRQVILDVEAEDFVAAANTLSMSNAIWARLKPIVLANQGEKVAGEFDQSLATQQKALEAKDGEALSDEANNGLELVDALEQLF
ncbi:MAG: hypothetical protein U0175_25055 [Caldilineaceae bacterium]